MFTYLKNVGQVFRSHAQVFAAYAFSFVATTIGRIVLIAVLSRFWSEGDVAFWLASSSLGYFASAADLGVARFYGNQAIIFWTENRRGCAIAAQSKLVHIVTAVALLIIAVSWACALLFDVRYLAGAATTTSRAQAGLILCALVLHGGLVMTCGALLVQYRMLGHDSRGVFIENSLRMAEAVMSCLFIAVGVAPTWVALALAGLRLLYTAALYRKYIRTVVCYGEAGSVASPIDSRVLSYAGIPLADALIQNILPGVLGMFLGASAVNSFSATRVYTRLLWQIPQIGRMSIMNELGRMVAKGKTSEIRNYISAVEAFSMLSMVVVAIPMFYWKDWFFAKWTGGALSPPGLEVAMLLLAAAMSGLALVPSAALEAGNRHVEYSALRVLIAAAQFVAILIGFNRGFGLMFTVLALAIGESVLYVITRNLYQKINRREH
jgi:O-antigen/teichoic acid export membrane protein